MDKFTRNYVIGLIGVLLSGGLVWLLNLDFTAARLNQRLADVEMIADYPFPFEVRRIDNGVATVTTPRSFKVPAVRFVGLLDPQLANKPADAPEVVQAQKQMAKVQGKVKEIVLEHPKVARINWVVDRDWYAQHGIQLSKQ